MKERPILFSGPMVRALLAGTKTQTRRALNARSLNLLATAAKAGECYELGATDPIHPNDMACYVQFCPYGQVGDRLWVRETHNKHGGLTSYRADGDWITDYHREQPEQPRLRWVPAIHMPRAASRILLEVTEVRVERLQDISEADALAEGITFTDYGLDQWQQQRQGWGVEATSHMQCMHSAPAAYGALWEQINGAGSWNTNPWVWAVKFNVSR